MNEKLSLLRRIEGARYRIADAEKMGWPALAESWRKTLAALLAEWKARYEQQ